MFVDEFGGDQRLQQIAAAPNMELGPGRCLQPAELVYDILAQALRGLPVDSLEGARDDVFRRPVERLPYRVVVVVRPIGDPERVGPASQEQVELTGDSLAYRLLPGVVEEWHGPAALGEPVPRVLLGATGPLHDAVQRDLGYRNDLSHHLPGSVVLPDELHLAFDPDLVRHEHAPGLERLVPLEPPLPAVDLGLKAEPRARLSPRVRSPALVLAVQVHFHRRVADHQLPDHAEAVAFFLGWFLYPRGAKGDLRIALRVEEIGAPQVGVAIGDTGVDARNVDGRFDTGLVGVIPVPAEGCLHVLEAAAHGGHHHVLYRELDARMGRVELPGGRPCLCGGCHVILLDEVSLPWG